MRLVSLTCSNTEIVAALGLADDLIGVDDFSDHPEEAVRGLPRLGPDLDIDVEAVQGLDPDLVLASLTVPGHENVVRELERAGLTFIAPAPESLEEVFDHIEEIAVALGVADRGRRLAARMRSELSAAAPPSEPRPSILVEWWPKPVIAPGRRSWATDLLWLAGAVNPIGEEEVPSRPLEDDEVAALDPDAVVVSWCGVDPAKYRLEVVLDNPAWQDLEFARHGRVFPVPEAFLGRPGPRLVEGHRRLRQIVEDLRQLS